MDDDVRRWRPKGTLYFWFEADHRHGDGWHIAADEAGCNDLEEVIALAKGSRYPSRFVFAPARPSRRTQTPVSKLVVSHNSQWQPQHWKVLRHGDDVTWELGDARLDELARVVGDLRRGDVDYPFGGEMPDERIWAWWPSK